MNLSEPSDQDTLPESVTRAANMTNVTTLCDEYCQDKIWSFWIEGVAVLFISVFGIFGNLLCLFVFNHKSVDLKPSFANILKCLSVYDTALLTGVMLLYSFPALSEAYTKNLKPYILPMGIPLTQVALTGSVYSVVIVATERYFNICKPFHKNLGSVCEGWGYISIIVVFSFLYNVTKFMEFQTTTKYNKDGTSYPEFELKPLRKDPTYHTALVVCNTIFMGLFPLMALTFLNWRIISAMNAATRRHNNISSLKRRDRAMSGLLTGVVVVLVVCHTPKTFLNIQESYHILRYGAMENPPLWGKIIVKFSHLLLTLSSAINILIYSYKDFKFRAVLRTFCASISSDRLSHEESIVDTDGQTNATTCTRLTADSLQSKTEANVECKDLVTSL